MAGVVASGITGDDGEILRQDVDDLPFAFIAPLGAYDHGGLAFFHSEAPSRRIRRADECPPPGSAHSLPAVCSAPKNSRDKRGKKSGMIFYVPSALNIKARGPTF